MTYGRYENRRGWREMRPRDEERSNWRSDEDRGFFERAGDEIASWFGDDDAGRRRDRDELRDDNRFSPRSQWGDRDERRYDRSPRFRDEGYRRPYTGRFSGRGFADQGEGPRDSQYDRGWSQRDFSGQASGLHDPHYSEWRRRQIDALDRDYDEYRRENEGRFESEFSQWRERRSTKRQLLGSVREHMTVVGSDGEHVGTVDKVRGDRIILAKSDSEDGRHHHIGCSMVDAIDGDTVRLSSTAADAKASFDRKTDRAFFRDEDREDGPHMLNRSFSGTY